MSAFGSFPFNAGGNISPCRFVKLDTSADNQVLQAGNDEKVIGIAHESKYQPPIENASDYAAVSGKSIQVYTPGNVCMLEYGGNVTRGKYLRSDANGKGVAIDSSGSNPQIIGAIALESGADGTLGRVLIVHAIAVPNSSYL